MTYEEFLRSKAHSIGESGFEPDFYPNIAFDFQRDVIKQAVNMGRMAIFLDTGLGKTLIQLAIAHNIVRHTNRKVLILTPLAVAFQFIQEAEKIAVPGVQYSRDGKHNSDIIICNYERLHLFNPDDFVGVICDESSILKNFKGAIKSHVTAFMKKVQYRYLSTATPSPNDYIELGTSSEALGYMGYMDMLTKFFKNNQNSIDSTNRNIGEKFYLKPHAENDFFAWVNQWSVMVKKPSDLGYDDTRYHLPDLIINRHEVKNQSLIDVNGQVQMFVPIAKSMTEVRHEQKQTEQQRSAKAAELAAGKTSVYWVNTNNESKLISDLDTEAYEIKGSMSIEQKEERLIAFSRGEVKRLITKPKITSFGLNWQHCNHTVYFPTFSYEQYYQAIRRFWRFGQTETVNVDLVISDGQRRVVDALQQKSEKAMELHAKLNENLKRVYTQNETSNQQIQLPKFI